MVVEAGKIVAIYYVLKVHGVVRYMRSPMLGDPPLEYLHGAGHLVPVLERALEGRRVGERFTVVVPPELGYGERKRSLQQRVPLDALHPLGPLEAGMVLQAETEDGRREALVIAEIDEENGFVILDANHPLAGQTLEFDVHVVDTRDPTPEEVERFRALPPIRRRPAPPDREAELAQLVREMTAPQPVQPVVPSPRPKESSNKRTLLPVFRAAEAASPPVLSTPHRSARKSDKKGIRLPVFQPGQAPTEVLRNGSRAPGAPAERDD
ncbi:peptidylprolyl isomerase [Thermomicrobium sp. 4228-Ro]|uniref:FKBP-type peptidyl-prolyl cis-trans isomerase n=1 Tax=Thermomicrobium sp. 4228-Ro TaxID=2993937 RepID=UPI00224938C5|nr:peptidylprolyl isomerase [Thermomicrobium sp. 4228-Ro]MCX2726373.1 peptidylprolyl isomerase [Thermomicrobium sp. 4228-Ro]